MLNFWSSLRFRSVPLPILPFLLADSVAGAAAGSVGGVPGGLHNPRVQRLRVPCLGSGSRLDHRFALVTVHTSICDNYCRASAGEQHTRGKDLYLPTYCLFLPCSMFPSITPNLAFILKKT